MGVHEFFWHPPDNWLIGSVTLGFSDRQEGQPVLPEHLHPGGRHEGGVPRDDVRGHLVPAAQGAGGHGQAAAVPHQVRWEINQPCIDTIFISGPLCLLRYNTNLKKAVLFFIPELCYINFTEISL